MNYAKTFAENLILQRKQRGLSQEQFAEELDVSRQAVSKWEAGINMPDIPKLIAIADKFGITIDSLLRSKSSDLKEKIGDINRSEASINIISEGNLGIMNIICYRVSQRAYILHKYFGTTYKA